MKNYDLITANINTLSTFMGILQMGVSCNNCPGNQYCSTTGHCRSHCQDALMTYLEQDVKEDDTWVNELKTIIDVNMSIQRENTYQNLKPDLKKINFFKDPYLSYNSAYQRLENEFKKYGKLIIAVDYDDTLYDFHKKGRTYTDVMNLLKRWEPYSEVIIFTGNGEDTYPQITEYLNEHNVKFKGINCQSSVQNKNPGKVYANVYLDDRIGLRQVFDELTKLITKIENKEVIPNGC